MKVLASVPALVRALEYGFGGADWITVRVIQALGAIGDKSAASALVKEPFLKSITEYSRYLVAAAVDALAAMDAREYAGDVVDAVLEFGRKNMAVGTEAAARLAGEPEVRRMVEALTDRDVAVTAASFLAALARRGEDGIALARSAGGIPALVRALGVEGPPSLRPMALHALCSIVSEDEAERLIKKAKDSGALKRDAADEA